MVVLVFSLFRQLCLINNDLKTLMGVQDGDLSLPLVVLCLSSGMLMRHDIKVRVTVVVQRIPIEKQRFLLKASFFTYSIINIVAAFLWIFGHMDSLSKI